MSFQTLADSLASFYRHQLLEFYAQNGSVVEFLVLIDNGLSVALNIEAYGAFGDNGTFTAFASGATILSFTKRNGSLIKHD